MSPRPKLIPELLQVCCLVVVLGNAKLIDRYALEIHACLSSDAWISYNYFKQIFKFSRPIPVVDEVNVPSVAICQGLVEWLEVIRVDVTYKQTGLCMPYIDQLAIFFNLCGHDFGDGMVCPKCPLDLCQFPVTPIR
jgi:hypothetical protein